ncbi:MAG: VOC family protein [Roseococcus sp.]|nr:VOC family protein [Roseococcus sp.]
MSATALALDHVGVCNRDLAPMAAAYETLGFTLTPIAQQSGRRTPEGPLERFATGNRCAFLRHGYIELLAILEPGLFDNRLGAFLARYEGLHILALAMDDAEANLARLRRGGLDIPGISPLERPVEGPEGPRARFSRLPFPDAPEGRIQLVQHHTPELVWQPRWMTHANAAEALEEVMLASAAPAESAARLSRLAGLPLEPDPAGGYLLRLPGAARAAGPEAPAMETRVRILPPEALGALLPGLAIPCLPFLAGFVLRTGDGNAAAARILAGRGVALPGGRLMAPPALAAGAAVVFAP